MTDTLKTAGDSVGAAITSAPAIAYAVVDGQLVSLLNGQPRYAYNDAERTLRQLCWRNDPNGDYDTTDDGEPVTVDDLLAIVNQWCAEDAPFVQGFFDENRKRWA